MTANDVEAAEVLLAEVRAGLGPLVAMVEQPFKVDSDALRETEEPVNALRMFILSQEPFVTLQRLHDKLVDYCRPTCDRHGWPHSDVEYQCPCPCHQTIRTT